MPLVTMKDVARHIGVAPITVSRVVNGEANVLPATRALVEAAVKELNYIPNRAARSLVGARSLRIGLLLHNPSSSFIGALLAGSLEEANRVNAHLIVADWKEGEDGLKAIRFLLESGANGLVVPAPACDDEAVLDIVRSSGLPAIAVATSRQSRGLSTISIDEHRAAFEMTRHIIALGHRRIGFIAGFDHPVSEARLAGYRDALTRSGIAFEEALIGHGLYTYRSGLDAAQKLIELSNRPTAIFASNDDMAVAAITVAHRKGLTVPDDITVCGFDDTALATTVWPELTTVHQPIRKMAQSAIALLTEAIRAEWRGQTMAERRIIMDFEVIQRQSSGSAGQHKDEPGWMPPSFRSS